MAATQIRRLSASRRAESLSENDTLLKPLNSSFIVTPVSPAPEKKKFKRRSGGSVGTPPPIDELNEVAVVARLLSPNENRKKFRHVSAGSVPTTENQNKSGMVTRLLNPAESRRKYRHRSAGSVVADDSKEASAGTRLLTDSDSHASGHSLISEGANSVFGHEPGSYVPISTADEKCDLGKAVTKKGKQCTERSSRRLVYKDGNCNITHGSVNKRKRRFLVDIFTTVVDMKWRYNLIMFAAGFFISWFFFALLWFVIATAHGDVWHREDDTDWKPCVANVYNFPTALLYSIETQHTIGYGFRHINAHCPDAFIVLMIQCCLGVFIQTMMAGIIFSKLSQPKKRAHTIMFSKKAVISKRDDEYCLLFRVGDMRRSHFVSTAIRALMVKDRRTKEGELIPLSQYPMDIQTETCLTDTTDNFVFLVWPITAVHKINRVSPLWDVSFKSLANEHFEIIVILEGVVESSGMTTQIRTSYLPNEILWAHKPASLLAFQKENGVYRIDYSQFHAVVPVTMPKCSAKEFAERLKLVPPRPELKKSATAPEFHSKSLALAGGHHIGGRHIGGSRSRWKMIRLMKASLPFGRRYATRNVHFVGGQKNEAEEITEDDLEDDDRYISIS